MVSDGLAVNFQIGEFCSQSGTSITMAATESGQSTLPAGLTFDAGTRTFGGVGPTVGAYLIDVTATASSSLTASFTLTSITCSVTNCA